jgi:hypothetical protein
MKINIKHVSILCLVLLMACTKLEQNLQDNLSTPGSRQL